MTKRGNLDTYEDRDRDWNFASTNQGLSGATKCWKRMNATKGPFSTSFRGRYPCLQNCKTINFFVLSYPAMALCYGSPRTLIQWVWMWENSFMVQTEWGTYLYTQLNWTDQHLSDFTVLTLILTLLESYCMRCFPEVLVHRAKLFPHWLCHITTALWNTIREMPT